MFLGVLLWILAEITLFWQLGQEYGFLRLMALTAFISFIGLWLLQRQAWRGLAAPTPGTLSTESLKTVMGVIGALLLIIPGFITDFIALSFLLPGVQLLWIRPLQRKVQAGSQGFQVIFNSFHRGPTAQRNSSASSQPASTLPRETPEIIDVDFKNIES